MNNELKNLLTKAARKQSKSMQELIKDPRVSGPYTDLIRLDEAKMEELKEALERVNEKYRQRIDAATDTLELTLKMLI